MKYDHKIIGSINEQTLKEFLWAVEGKDWKEEPTFSIFLESQGGMVEPAFAIYDYITTHKIPTVIHCGGRVMSSALIILAAAQKKCAYKSCMFMFHEMSAEDKKVRKKVKKLTDAYTRMYSFLYPNIAWNTEECLYMTAREAYLNEVVDEIL